MRSGIFKGGACGLLLASLVVGFEVVCQQVDVSIPSTTSVSMEDVSSFQEKDIYNPKGFWPLLGAGIGYMGKTDTIRSEGLPAHLRFIGSYYFQGPWVSEVGGGIYNEILSQRGGGADTIQELEVEAAARYQLPSRWSVGPVWTTLTGNNRYRSNTKNWTSFLGLQVKRDIAWDNKHLVRLGGRFMTDVGVSGEQINAALFEVEVGLGSGEPAAFVEVEPAPIAPHLAEQAMSGPIVFDGPLNFIENQPNLISTASRRADRLAQVLADNSELYESIEIVGHADERGTADFNQTLSERRAEAMAHRFRRAGLPDFKLKVEGKGESEPVAFNNSETSWFKNRRVEVRILGVKDQAALESLLRPLR